MENELKTLKDMTVPEYRGLKAVGVVSIQELKQEAIKWVKEDIFPSHRDGMDSYTKRVLTERWMKRLDITEEDENE